MNKVFKVVWCETTGSWVAVSEIAKAQGKTKSKTNKLAKAGLTLMGLASAVAGVEAQAATISATGAGTSNLNRPIATSESSLAVGVSSSTSSFNRAVAAGFGATVQGDDAVAFGYNVTARKDATSTAGQSTVVGVNSTANYGGVAIGYAAQSGGVSQSIAIGHSANASGDQSLSIGANTKTVGNSSIAIGGDDLDRTSATGAARTYTTLTGDTIRSNVYTCTTTGEAAVAIGVQASAADLATAFGTRVHASGIGSVGVGVGAVADKNTSVALGAGSKTQTDAKGIASATVNGVTYNGFAGGDKIEVGDQVAVGAVGFERQIKHVAPGEITATSTDAINGSQLYMIAKGLQETRAAVAGGANSYFHVNNNTTSQAAGESATNFGPTDSKGGATGAFALAAGVNATATGINSTAIGTNVNASALGSIVIGTNSHLKGASALSGGVPAGTTQVGTSKDGDTPFVVIGYNTSSQSRFGDTILGSWAKTENPNFAINQGTAVGNRAIVYGDQGVALGADTRALGNSSVAIGGDDLDKAAGKLAKLLGATVSSDTAPTPQDITNVTNKYETFRKDLSADIQDYIADKIPTSHRNQSLHGREYPNTAAIGDASLAIGTGSQTLGVASNAIGANALAKGLSSTAVGTLSRAWGESSIAMGTQANASTLNSIVLGHDAKADAVIDGDSHQVVIGNNASSNISNQVVMGSNTTGGAMTGSVVVGTGAKGHTLGTDRFSNHTAYNNPYSLIGKRMTDTGAATGLLARNSGTNDTEIFGSSVTVVGYEAEANAGGVALGDNARAVRNAPGGRGLGVAIGANSVSEGGGIAVGSAATTEGINSVAIGRQSVAKTSGAQAIGVASAAVGTLSLAVGSSATSTGERSIAIGSSTSNETYSATTNVRSEGKNAVALGAKARVGENYVDQARPKAGTLTAQELADWNKKIADESTRAGVFTENSIAIGADAIVKSKVAATTGTTVNANNNASHSVAVGSGATVTSNSSVAVGHGASASGENSTAIGRGAVASGKNSISVGLANQVSGENSGAFGDPSVVEGTNSYSIGNNNAIGGTTDNGIALGGQNNLGGTATRNDQGVITGTSVTEDGSASRSMVIGYKNTVKSDDVMVLGNNVTVGTGLSGSVILGQNAGTQGSHAIANETKATVNGIEYGTFAGKVADTGRFVSVGKAGDERKIINVAAGNISATSTEAINGSQLYAVMDKMPVVSTVSNEGGKIKNDAPTNPNAVATTSSVATAVNNSYWTLQNNTAEVGKVNPGDKVNFTSNDKTVTITATPENQDTSALDFKVNVDGSTIKVNEQGQLYAVVPPSTTPPSVENTTLNVTDGKVVQPATTATTGTPDGNKLVNATTVANAINNAGWQVFEHENAPTNLKDTVTAGDKVVFANGTGTTASVETVDNVTTVKFNANTDVQTSPNPAGDVKVDNNTGDNLVNGTTLVNTVNNASFSLTTGGNTDTPAVTSKVKAGSTVKLVGGKGINVSQANNDVTINAKVDGTTITTNDEGELVANTTTLTPTVNGNIEKPTEGDKLVNATTVANAINESGWKLGDNAGNTNVIKPSTQVNFVNGTNTVSSVTPNAAGNGYDVSYSVANTTLAQTPSPTAPNSVTKFDAPAPADENKVVNAGDLAKALNNVGFNVLAGQTGTGTNSGKVESTAVKTGDTVKFIAGDNVNINQNGSEFTISTSASPVSVTNTTLTPNSTTGKIDTPTQPDGNNLVNATTVANAINNAGWTTSTTDNPSEKVVINPGDAVNYVNGTGTTANVVKNTDGGVNVSYNVNTAEAPKVNDNGSVAVPTANGDHFVNATTLANTLNNVSHNVTIGSDTATFADQDGKKDSQVKAGDTITLKSGKNLIAKQDGNNITFATAENVTFNNVNTTTLSVGGNASQPAGANNPVVNFKTEAAKPATNNAANKVEAPTSALNITSADGKPTQITGVGSSLNTTTVATNPDANTGTAPVDATLVNLNNTTANPVNPTAVATVGDLQNMGWVVSTQTGEYKDTVKNANEVKFIGKDGVTVTGETNAQGVREITVIAETDGTTITTNDEGELVANTTTLTPTVNGNIEKPTEGDKLVNATTVANAINESGWKLGDNAGNTNVIKPSTQVNFVNGTNTVSSVTPNAAGNGYDVSYSVANTTLAQTPSPTAPNSVTKFDAPAPADENKVVNAGDLAKALNNVGFNVLAGQTGTGTNSGKVESTAVKTGDTVKFIAGDNVNINQNGSEFTISTSASPVSVTNTTLTPNSTTGKIDTPTQPDGNNLVNATTVANAINNAGWTTSTTDNPSEKVVINPGDAVNYVNGTGTTANVVKNTDGGVNVSYNVNTAEAPKVNDNGSVAVPTANGDHFVNATTLANTLNNVSHNVTIGSDTATFADQDGKKDSQVKAGDTITLKSGKNLIAKQDGNNITFATAENVTFNNVNTTTLSVGGNASQPAGANNPVVNFKTEAAKPATNNAANKVEAPTSALNITSADGKPTQITGVGSSLNTTTVATNPDANTGTAPVDATLVNLNNTTANPVNPTAVATVGDLQNMGWVVSTQTGEYKDTVKNANEVKFIGKDGVTVTGETNAQGVREITVIAETDGTTITTNDEGELVANTTTLTPTVNGNIEKPTEGDKLVNATTVANAINESGWKLGDNAGNTNVIKPSTQVNFVNGTNTVSSVTPNAAGNGYDVSYSVANTTLAQTPSPTAPNSVTKFDAPAPADENKVVNAGDLAKALNNVGFNVLAGQTGTGTNSGKVESTAVKTGDTVKFIAGDNVNINQNGSEFTISTSASPVSVTNTTLTPNSTTGKIDTPTQPDGNNLVNATTVANAINNAGWTTSTTDNPSEKVVINPGDAVNYVNGTGTTANVVKNTDGGVNVSYNVNTAEAPKVNDNGSVAVPTANGDHFVNATTLANTLNNVSHNVTIGSDTATFADQDGKKDSQVKAGDTITLKSGKNLIAKQDGNNITFATAENVTFNNVNTTTLSVGGNASQPAGANNPVVNFKTEAAKPATNNAANKVEAPTSALNITSADGKPTQITGVGSSLNTTTVATNPDANTGTAPVDATLVNLNNTTANPVNPTAVATVGDLQNMGWVVSTQTGEYKDTVKNANEVKFIGTGAATVTGVTNTTSGVREITIDVKTPEAAQLPVVYTTTTGDKVVKAKNGNFYKPNEVDSDGNVITPTGGTAPTPTAPADVIASMNSGGNSSTTPTTLANVKGNLNPAYNVGDTQEGATKKLDGTPATNATPSQTAPANVASMYNNAATVGDVLNAGWNLQENSVAKDFVKAYDTVNFVNGSGTIANVTVLDGGKVANVTYNVKVDDSTIKVNTTTGALEAVIPTDTVASVQNGDTTTVKAEGTTEAPIYKVEVNKANVTATPTDTSDPNNVTVNTAGKVVAPTNTTVAGNTFLTAGDVANVINNSGWTTTNSNGDKVVVNPGDTVNYESGNGTTANVVTEGNTTTVKFDVNTAKEPTVNPNGTVATPTGTEGSNFVNATTLANTVNNVSWNVTAFGANATGAKEEQVKAGEVVTFEAGKNMTLTQNGQNFTYATADNVTFNNVNTTTLTVGDVSNPASANNPVVNIKTEAAKPATNNVEQPTSALNITSADGKPTQITGVGSSLNTTTVNTNPFTGGTSSPSTSTLVNLNNTPANPVNSNAVATVGDLQNMGWVVSASNGYSDTVKNANEVKFVAGNGITVTGETKGDIREIKIETNAQTQTNSSQLPVVYTLADGTKVYPNPNGNGTFTENADGTGATYPAGDVIASMNSGDNSTTTPTTLANVKGNLKPTYNKDDLTEDAAKKLTATTAPTATTNATAPTNDELKNIYGNAATVGDVLNAGWNLQENGTAKDFVKPYDTVGFVNGTGTTANVSVNADGSVANVTFNVNKAEVTLPTAGTPTSADENKVTINEAGKVVAPTNTTVAGNTFLTTGDVANVINNSGWTTKNTDGTTSVINPGDAVNYVNGNGTTANVVTEGNTTTVKFDVNTAKEPTVNPNGTVATPTGTEGSNFVNATTLANTVNNVSWNVTAFGANATGAKEEQVKAGEVVTFEAGKNMTLTQNGQNFTYATADNVTFNNVNTTTLSVGNPQTPNVVNFTTEAAKPADNNPTTNAPTTALNITSADGKPTQITGVGSSLNTTTVATMPKGDGVVTPVDQQPKLVDLSSPTVNSNAVATVGDLQNMGWVVSAGDSYKDAVKNANEVKFVGGTGITVKGETKGDIREIVIETNAQAQTNNSQLPVVYTLANGTKVYPNPNGDGSFTENADGTGATYPAGDVIASMNSAGNNTTAPTTLANVKGNLAPAYNEGSLTENADKKLTDVPATTAQITKEAKAPTGEDLKKVYNNAATVGDVLNAGFNVQENGTAKDFVKAYDTVGFVNGTGTTANVTVNADGSVANVTFNVNKAGVNTVPTNTADANNVTVNNKGQAVKPTDAAKAGDSFLTAGDVVDVVNNTGWTTKNTDGSTTVVKPGHAVNFVDGNGITSNVTTADGVTTVKFDLNSGKIDSTGGVASNTTNGIATTGDVVNAINNSGWNAVANNGANPELINPGETVSFNNGTNVVVTQTGNNFTFATTKDIGVEGNLTVAGNTTLGNVTVKPNSNVNMGNNTVAGVKSNLVDVTPQTNAQPTANSPADQAVNKNNAATVGDVLNAGWNLQGNGQAVDTVVHNDTVNFEDGRGSNVVVAKDPATGANSIKVNTAVGYVTETGTETTTPSNIVKVFGGNASAPVQVTNVASGVMNKDGTMPANRTQAIQNATGDTLNNAANIGDLQALQMNVTNVQNNITQVIGDPEIIKTYDAAGNTEKHTISIVTAINNMNKEGIRFFHTNSEEKADGTNIKKNAVDSSASGTHATAIGYQTSASGNNTVALGNSINAKPDDPNNKPLLASTDPNKIKIEDATQANGAIYTTYTNTDTNEAYTAQTTRADGERAIAIGTGSQALGNQTIAIGVGNVVTGENSGAFGDPNFVSGSESYAFGNNNNITTTNTHVVGNNVTVTADNSVALGNNASITAGNAVGTVAKKTDGTVGTTTTAGTTGTVETATVGGVTYGNFAGHTANGAVSVGASGAERRIQNVAAGEISATSTDAINGSQLYAVAGAVSNIAGDINNLNKRLGDVEDNAYGGVAQAIATAGLPQAYLPGKSLVAVGAGHYKGETGYAVSFSSISDGGNWIFKGTGSGSSQGNVGGSVAIGYQW